MLKMISIFNFSGSAIPRMGCSFMHNGTKSTIRIQWKPIHIDGHLQWILFNLFPECIHVRKCIFFFKFELTYLLGTNQLLKWGLKFKLSKFVLEPTHRNIVYLSLKGKLVPEYILLSYKSTCALCSLCIFWIENMQHNFDVHFEMENHFVYKLLIMYYYCWYVSIVETWPKAI